MNYNIIATGSDGNAVVLNGNILIDCGVAFKSLISVYRNLSVVLLTHIHSDHFKTSTITRLAYERPRLRFCCCPWLAEALVKAKVRKKNIDILEPGSTYDYGFAKIEPVELHHDVPNCGYKIRIGNERVFYATDTGHLDGIEALDYDLYMIEANHKQDEIIEKIRQKKADGIYPYEQEVILNHLSKEQADDFIAANAGANSKYVYLHQHKDREDSNA